MELQSLLAEFEILKEYDQVLSHVFSLFHELLRCRAVLECRYSLRLVLFPSMVFLDYQMESKQSELCHFVLKKTRDLLDCGMDDIQPIENSLQLIVGDSDVGGRIIMLANFFVMLAIFSMY